MALAGRDARFTAFSCPRSPLSFEITRKYMRDVIAGLEYLHHQGVVHRDIKVREGGRKTGDGRGRETCEGPGD